MAYRTEQRERLYGVFEENPHAVFSARELTDQIGEGISLSAVYRNLADLEATGNEIVYGLGWMAENSDGLLTDHVHAHDGAGGNVAEGLEALLHVYKCEVAICDPDDDNWPELEVSRVLLDNENLRIKVRISPAFSSFDLCRLVMGSNVVVTTSGTCPAGVEIPVAASEFSNHGSYSEIRIERSYNQLRTLGLLPSQDDGVNEMAWVDIVETEGQSLADSEAFSSL